MTSTTAMIDIDGSQGEGGGQILRSALSLAAVTGTPVRVSRIRAGRSKPGLQRQHLMAVQAAAAISAAEVVGAELGSKELTFRPQAISGGDWHFDIGSAGSTTMVLQTVLPILAAAPAPSQVRVDGGTHNGMAPPVEFLQESLLPVLGRIGLDCHLELLRHGFEAAGGGSIIARIQPWTAPAPLELLARGRQGPRQASAVIAHLPKHIAQREAAALKHALHWSQREVQELEVPADGPGNILLARLQYESITSVFSAVGQLRKPAEKVAAELARQVSRYLQGSAPVEEHLADQLLLPLALGAGGRFRCSILSEHSRTNAAVIAAFLGKVVTWQDLGDAGWEVTVCGRS